MARNENPPFPRGGLGTAYDDPSTVNTTGNSHLEGMEWVFEDKDFNAAVDGVVPDRSNQFVVCRVVRNVSGGALLPKRAAKLNAAGTVTGNYGGQISGYASLGDACVIIDEFLPAAGVPNNELCWGVVEGPTTVTTDASGTTTLTIGLYAIPGSNGKVVAQDTTVAAGAATFNQIQGALGRAMTAVAAINTDFLINKRRMDA